jgi:hypothetical protein
MTLIPLAVLTAWPTVDVIPPQNLADVYAWRFNIVSDSAYRDVRLTGWVRAGDALVYACTTSTFNLNQGSRMLSLQDVHVQKQWAARGYEAFTIRAGALPAGEYDYGVILLPFGVGDTGHKPVRPVDPPRLISPRMGDTVRTPYPLFVWTPPPSPPAEPVTYELKVVEVMEGQTKDEAMRANPAWFEEKVSDGTSLKYPSSAKAFEKSKQYAWRIRPEFWPVDGLDSETETFYTGAGFPGGGTEPAAFPITLILPEAGADLSTPVPTFVWSKPAGAPKSRRAEYTLTLLELDTTSQPKVLDSMKPFFRKTGIKETTYTYTQKDPALGKGKVYAWSVIDGMHPEPARWRLIYYRAEYDYGDAPDLPYRTLKVRSGARHHCGEVTIWSNGGLWVYIHEGPISFKRLAWLGPLPAGYNPSAPYCLPASPPSVTWEPDARVPSDDRDDGVFFYRPATTYCAGCDSGFVDVMVSIRPSLFDRTQHLYLYGWIDFHTNGDWDDVHTCTTPPFTGLPVNDAVVWLSATPKFPSSVAANPILFDHGRGVDINPATWPVSVGSAIYRLRFVSCINCSLQESMIWTRFRLSPGDTQGGVSFPQTNAGSYTGDVVSGEVEDLWLPCTPSPNPNPPRCRIEKVYVADQSVSLNGQTVHAASGAASIRILATGGDVDNYYLDITKPTGTHEPLMSNTTGTFSYILSPTGAGQYSITAAVMCHDGSLAYLQFYIIVP